MKKLFKEVLPVAAIVASAFSVLTVTSGSTQANSASQNTTSTTQTTAMAVLPGQPVDLSAAAEKALPSVVHIKYVQNSKIQTVEVQSDPFEDFFSDPFADFFGRGQQGQEGDVRSCGPPSWGIVPYARALPRFRGSRLEERDRPHAGIFRKGYRGDR